MKEVYVLMADGDGTLRSSDTPFGVAVTSEEEAERFIKEGGWGYTHSWAKVRIFENKDEALEWAQKRSVEECEEYWDEFDKNGFVD